MREYKFRAWHEGYTHPSKTPPKMLYDEKPGDCLVWKNQSQPVKVMQFTGFQDKNGVDIYEGDIIKEFTERVGVIEWEDTIGSFMYDDGSGDIGIEGAGDWAEVIGNIYENPKLLIRKYTYELS